MALLEHIVQRRSTLSPWERAGGEGHLRMAGQASPPLEDSHPNPLPEGRGAIKLAPSADAVAENGGTLNCAPSAVADAGNGRPLSYSLRSPSADAVAGRGERRSHSARSDSVCPVWVHRFAVVTAGATL